MHIQTYLEAAVTPILGTFWRSAGVLLLLARSRRYPIRIRDTASRADTVMGAELLATAARDALEERRIR